MSVIHFTSDLHIGHTWVARLRGFATAAEHDEWLCDTWVEHVHKRDQVWVLGDLALGRLAYALEIVDRLPGSKNLVWGNHDSGHPMHRGAPRMQRKYLEVFRSVQQSARMKVQGHDFLLSHFPYLTGELEEQDHTDAPRYSQWRLPDEGQWLLHGHTHRADQQLHGRQIHVGWDAWRRPVSHDQVAEIITEEERDG